MDTLLLPAKAASLNAFHELVMRKAEPLCPAREKALDIRLVLEEILTNIIFHAYPDGEGDVEVGCSIEGCGRLCLTIKDRGMPFNPLDHPAPDLSGDIADRDIGGMGIHLFRRLADELHYAREEDRNLLTVCFNL